MLPQLIELIYYALASNDIRILIFGLLKDYFKDKSLQETLKNENVSKEELDQPYSLFNPNILKKLLNIITPDEFKYIQSKINKVKNLVNKFNEKATTKEDEEPINKDEKGWIQLSSSWFKKGNFQINNKSLQQGLLTGMFQSDTSKNKRWYGPYTYPSVPQEVWILMTQARGKNGTGAGTVFWRYYLKSFLPSQIRKYTKKNLKNTLGITKGNQRYYLIKINNINLSKTTQFINKLERGFFKLKEYKSLSKTEIGSINYRKTRKQILITISKYNTYRRYK